MPSGSARAFDARPKQLKSVTAPNRLKVIAIIVGSAEWSHATAREHKPERRSALHAQDLFQFSYDLHQVSLLSHYLLDVLVCLGGFVHHATVLATFHAFGLAFEI